MTKNSRGRNRVCYLRRHRRGDVLANRAAARSIIARPEISPGRKEESPPRAIFTTVDCDEHRHLHARAAPGARPPANRGRMFIQRTAVHYSRNNIGGRANCALAAARIYAGFHMRVPALRLRAGAHTRRRNGMGKWKKTRGRIATSSSRSAAHG